MVRHPPRPPPFPYAPLFRSFRAVLQLLAGDDPEAEIASRLGPPAAGLRKAQPEDTIIITFSTHGDRKSTRLNSSHANISYAVFCLKKTIYFYTDARCSCWLR